MPGMQQFNVKGKVVGNCMLITVTVGSGDSYRDLAWKTVSEEAIEVDSKKGTWHDTIVKALTEFAKIM